MYTTSRVACIIRLCAFLAVWITTGGCGLDKETAPELAGPSEFGVSLTLTASPDVLVQDGVSISTITAVALDPAGNPIANVSLLWRGFASSLAAVPTVTLTQQTSVTNAEGRSSIGLVAPAPPVVMPDDDVTITVTATPTGRLGTEENFNNATPRTVLVQLQPPLGTPQPNNDPVAVIVADPPIAVVNQTIRFDASLSTDEGQACGAKCSYIWEFGDGTVEKGITVIHAYTSADTFTVTLSVTDDRGGLDEATVDIRIVP